MNTTRILKVLALAMTANPKLPIPLTLDNIELDDIRATPDAKHNTAATMYARDTGEVVRYVGNSGVVYDRIDIAQYWRPEAIIEAPTAVTVGDLADILKSRYGLDVLREELLNTDQLLPDAGTVHIAIDDSVSPLYIGEVDVLFAKDAGLSGKDGLAYVLGQIVSGSNPIIGYVDNQKDSVEVSIDNGVWHTVTPSRIGDGIYSIVSPVTITATSANVRIRGTKPMLMDFDNRYVPITKLIQYKSLTDATAFFTGIPTLTEIEAGAFDTRPDLTNADYVFDGCINLTRVPDYLFSKCPQLLSAKAALRKTAITTVPETLLESCSKLTNANMLFEQCSQLTAIPAKLFLTNTALKSISRCFMGCPSIGDEIPQGLLDTLVNLEDASYLFAANPWVTTLPDGLLSKCTGLKDISGLFSHCTELMVIPSDLLYGLTNLRRVSRLFEGCSKIAGIPPGLFISNINLEYADYAFASSGILTTPAVMFTYTRRLLSIDYIFSNCVKLNAIPSSLLSPLLRLQSANGVWMNCIGVTSLPTGLLDGNVNLISLAWTFSNTGITAVPPGLLSLLVKVSDISGLFSKTNITTIPSDVIATMGALKKVEQLFWKCGTLSSVPSDLFQANTQLESVMGLFAYCTSLGAPITSWFTVGSSSIKNCSGCFQGAVAITGNFADFRALLPGVDWSEEDDTQGVVAGCTALGDYASIGTIYKTPLPLLA